MRDETKANKEKISGNIWVSPNIIGMYMWFAMMFFVVSYSKQKIFNGIFMFVGGILFFMRDSLQMYYFILGEDYITIKNHFIPWEFEDIFYSDIAELRIDMIHKPPYRLTIVKSNGLTDAYPADSLSTKNWIRLSQIVAKKGIKLVDNASVLS